MNGKSSSATTSIGSNAVEDSINTEGSINGNHHQRNEVDYTVKECHNGCIYLDYNGTTPIYKDVYDSMIPYLTTYFGNPSSIHHTYGQKPYTAVQIAREQIVSLLLQNTNTTTTETSTTSASTGSTTQLVEEIYKQQHHYTNSKSFRVIFTGCGTEANNLAIHIAIQTFEKQQQQQQGEFILPHIVTTNIEHPAILQYLHYYSIIQKRCTVTYVTVQNNGIVRSDDIISAIRPLQTILVTVMYANNEVGSLQPVYEIGSYCSNHNILFHTDSAQAVGKVTMDYNTIGQPSMISIVGHKIGAPKGIACLVINTKHLQSKNYDDTMNENGENATKIIQDYDGLLFGGGQEYNLRAGTENVPYIVGFGMACEICTNTWTNNQEHMEQLRTLLVQELQNNLQHYYNNNNEEEEKDGKPVLLVNGPISCSERLPNTLSIGIRNINSSILLQQIGHLVAASAGAACHSSSKAACTNSKSDNEEEDATQSTLSTTSSTSTSSSTSIVSNVLKVMNIPIEYALGTIRFSIGPLTTTDEIIQAAAIVSNAVIEYYTEKKKNQYVNK